MFDPRNRLYVFYDDNNVFSDFSDDAQDYARDEFDTVRDLLRNKIVHGTFNYVVPINKYLPKHALPQAWVVIDPNTNIKELNSKRDRVKRGPWQKLEVEEFLHKTDESGSTHAVPAVDILRDLLKFCLYVYQEVAKCAVSH